MVLQLISWILEFFQHSDHAYVYLPVLGKVLGVATRAVVRQVVTALFLAQFSFFVSVLHHSYVISLLSLCYGSMDTSHTNHKS